MRILRSNHESRVVLPHEWVVLGIPVHHQIFTTKPFPVETLLLHPAGKELWGAVAKEPFVVTTPKSATAKLWVARQLTGDGCTLQVLGKECHGPVRLRSHRFRTIEELAAHLGVSTMTLANMANRLQLQTHGHAEFLSFNTVFHLSAAVQFGATL